MKRPMTNFERFTICAMLITIAPPILLYTVTFIYTIRYWPHAPPNAWWYLTDGLAAIYMLLALPVLALAVYKKHQNGPDG